MLAEILDHVVSFEFAVNDYVEADVFLLLDALTDLVLVERNILFFCDGAVLEIFSVLSYVLCLRERTDRRCGEERELKELFLDFLSFFKSGKSRVVFFLD